MRVKTSVTLDEDVVSAIEAIAGEGESRSRTIERLLRQCLTARKRADIDDRDREIIDAHADELAAEAIDVLGYQIKTGGPGPRQVGA
ncbi:MAG: hypothetical protein F4057_05910 [Acidobacteria bacterium]|nr:hypothetical protein [Acidobacteriota bacterium]